MFPEHQNGINGNIFVPKREKLSTSFFKAGIDWRKELVKAVKDQNHKMIRVWFELLPYLMGPEQKNEGRPRKARKPTAKALATLRKLEHKARPDLYPNPSLESNPSALDADKDF